VTALTNDAFTIDNTTLFSEHCIGVTQPCCVAVLGHTAPSTYALPPASQLQVPCFIFCTCQQTSLCSEPRTALRVSALQNNHTRNTTVTKSNNLAVTNTFSVLSTKQFSVRRTLCGYATSLPVSRIISRLISQEKTVFDEELFLVTLFYVSVIQKWTHCYSYNPTLLSVVPVDTFTARVFEHKTELGTDAVRWPSSSRSLLHACLNV
jgi:hypothetical protein